MSNISYGQIARNGFWDANPGLAQLLGLCPTLAVTATVVNAIGLGLATTLVLMASNVTVSMIRNVVPNEVRIPVFVLVIAAFVTVVQMLMQAYFYDLYKVLGIFVPLIVTNCIIIGRAEAFASKNTVNHSLFDGLAMGLGFTSTLVVLGAMREIIGRGTIFGNAQVMFGEWAHGLTTTLIPHYHGYLIAILPPGAFLGLGLLVALKNVIDRRAEARRKAAAAVPADQAATA